ncbi:hypothetical protein GCM10010295_13290 [Streptomyces intermedius]
MRGLRPERGGHLQLGGVELREGGVQRAHHERRAVRDLGEKYPHGVVRKWNGPLGPAGDARPDAVGQPGVAVDEEQRQGDQEGREGEEDVDELGDGLRAAPERRGAGRRAPGA